MIKLEIQYLLIMDTQADKPDQPVSGWVDWEAILESISNERCIVCVGPNIYSGETEHLEEELAKYLKADADRLRIRVYDNGWFHYLPGSNYIQPYCRYKEFFNQSFPKAEEIFSQLVKIPFHLFISVNPDYKLREAFTKQALPVKFEAFCKGRPHNQDMSPPTISQPILFNLLGELNQRESLVLTYDDFYDYLRSIFEGKSFPPILRDCIERTDNFIFLGLPFDQWYMHLFLRLLNQHQSKHLLKYAPTVLTDDAIQTFCREQFNITFVSSNIKNFVGELYQRCQTSGILREPKSMDWAVDASAIQELIRKDDIDSALETLISAFSQGGAQTKEWLNEAIMLESRFQSLEKRYRRNVIRFQDYEVERAMIIERLLKLLDLISGDHFWRFA